MRGQERSHQRGALRTRRAEPGAGRSAEWLYRSCNKSHPVQLPHHNHSTLSQPHAPVHRHCVVTLCCSPRKAAAELALVIKNVRELKQSSPTSPSPAATAWRFSGELEVNAVVAQAADDVGRYESVRASPHASCPSPVTAHRSPPPAARGLALRVIGDSGKLIFHALTPALPAISLCGHLPTAMQLPLTKVQAFESPLTSPSESRPSTMRVVRRRPKVVSRPQLQ